MKHSKCVPVVKAKTHCGRNLVAVGRLKADDPAGQEIKGDELTLVAACRDVLRVVSAQEGTGSDDDVEPVISDAEDLS